jgi:hypothetical protein
MIMATTSITDQILNAVENDPGAIRDLAGAVARGDASAIRSTLGARGVALSEGDVAAILQTAHAGASGVAFSMSLSVS